MTAVTAYAAYLRCKTGAQPETATAGHGVTLICRRGPGRRLTVTFRYAIDKREWRPTGIHVACGGPRRQLSAGKAGRSAGHTAPHAGR